MIRSNLSLTLATGGCFVTTHCKEHLIVGADEEIIVLRWLAPGERRPKAGAGGLCVVSRAPTPSHNVVTSLSAIPCQDKDEEGKADEEVTKAVWKAMESGIVMVN